MRRTSFSLVVWALLFSWVSGLRAADAPDAALPRLPDPLVMSDGQQVTTAKAWMTRRRPEVLELFRTHVYGRSSVGRPDSLAFRVLSAERGVLDGLADRKEVEIAYSGRGGKGAIRLVLLVPARSKPSPCFILICNRDVMNIDPTRQQKSAFWPAEEMLARGYAAAAFLTADVDPDFHDGFTNGVHGVFDGSAGARPGDAWGTIGAWAWGASRVMDYLETDPDIDARRVGLVGHSRGGKTALWAGAQDERFAMVVSNDSGCGGAAIARQKAPGAETLAIINKAFPHWFCANYKGYSDREEELPVDQHMLAALVAPRLLYIASASEDRWANPPAEFRCAVEAGRVYRLFGKAGLGAATMPAPDTPVHGDGVAYHIRTGKHDLTVYDWMRFLDFADRQMKKTP